MYLSSLDPILLILCHRNALNKSSLAKAQKISLIRLHDAAAKEAVSIQCDPIPSLCGSPRGESGKMFQHGSLLSTLIFEVLISVSDKIDLLALSGAAISNLICD
jgi:hypothetical protein